MYDGKMWMCDVLLKDRKCCSDLYSLLGIPCVADVLRRAKIDWEGLGISST